MYRKRGHKDINDQRGNFTNKCVNFKKKVKNNMFIIENFNSIVQFFTIY